MAVQTIYFLNYFYESVILTELLLSIKYMETWESNFNDFHENNYKSVASSISSYNYFVRNNILTLQIANVVGMVSADVT